MENIFNQKPDDSGSGRDLCRQRTAGLCLLCNIIQQLIADENN